MIFMAVGTSLLVGAASAHQPSKSATQSACRSHKTGRFIASHTTKHGKPVVSAKTTQDSGVGPRIGPAPEIKWWMPNTFELIKAGKEAAAHGAWQEARSNYQQVLAVEPSNQDAIYGMAKCAGAAGDVESEIKYFRIAIYAHDASQYGTLSPNSFRGGDPDKLMTYVLLLSQTGQDQESLFVYHRAADLLNYEQGRPILKVLLPELVAVRTLPAQVRYTPERLQALAETALAHEEMGFGSDKEALAHLREAVKLYPDSPVTNYYLGEGLLGTDDPGAKAAYQKAAQLGDDQTIAAANERIKTCR